MDPGMSVVRMRNEPTAKPLTGGMDRAIEKKRIPRRTVAIAGAAMLLLVALAWWFAPRGNRQTVPVDRLAISTVQRGTFDDYLPLRARVTPLVTVFLDAVAGGRIERVLVEDGATVAKGQLLAVLSNADLQLSTLARETEVAEQLNNLRVTEIALNRTRLDNERDVALAEADLAKSRRQYQLQAPLAQRGFVAARAFGDTRDDFSYQQKRLRVIQDAQSTDLKMQASQLTQLRATADSLQSALAIARANLDQLNLRAPVAGQLTAFSIQVGESMSPGARLGQIDSPGRNKLRANVDEFYLGRIQPGQTATLDRAGKAYTLRVAKVFPQVTNGQFEVDLWFVGPEPTGIQRGQTLQAKLTLGDSSPAVLIPNGAFYGDTGGAWVFVVAPDGRSAEKRQVRLGRRNADFIEVLDGLESGEKVITSPYTGLADKDRLDLARN
jgi:HlyD family secretion protein